MASPANKQVSDIFKNMNIMSRPRFNVNSVMMFVCDQSDKWQLRKKVSQDIVKVKIQNKEVKQYQGQDPEKGSFSNTMSWPRSKFLKTMSRPRSRTVFNIQVVAQLVFQ